MPLSEIDKARLSQAQEVKRESARNAQLDNEERRREEAADARQTTHQHEREMLGKERTVPCGGGWAVTITGDDKAGFKTEVFRPDGGTHQVFTARSIADAEMQARMIAKLNHALPGEAAKS